MSRTQKDLLEDYEFQITVFEDADDDYLRILFVRLQLGLLLNTGEKLNAARGRMKQLVFEKLAKHQFIVHLGIPERRYARQTLCAQIAINSFTRAKLKAFARTRYDDLLHFFEEYEAPQGRDLQFFKTQSDQIQEVLDQLWDTFRHRAAGLKNRSFVLSIYLLMEELTSKQRALSPSDRKLFSDFTFELWKNLRQEMTLGMDRRNRELYLFQTLLSSAPGEEYQIRRRHEKLLEFFQHFQDTGKIKGNR
jgi:hypothetical protein